MKITLLFIALVFSSNVFGQIIFEKGYILTSDGLKHECFIRNKDWANNPKVIEYKLSTDGEVMQGSILNIREFKVEGYSKYIRAAVEIDRSSRTASNLSRQSAPEFEKDELFLEVIVEDSASLYMYRGKNIERFFFSTNDTPITQLIYKEYLVNNSVKENNTYLAQLRSYVQCSGLPDMKTKAPGYNRKNLESYFNEVNACNSGTVLTKEKKKGRGQFNLYLTPGLTYSSMTVDAWGNPTRDAEFADKLTFRMGVEAEFVFGFNKNKWAFLIEPSYHYYKDETDIKSVDFAYLEFPVGLRHYFHLKRSAIFVNAIFIPWWNVLLKNDLVMGEGYEPVLAIDVAYSSVAFGVGVKRGRFRSEVRIYSKKDLYIFSPNLPIDYPRFDCIVGFQIK